MFLNPQELKQLTGKVRGPDQAVELQKMGVHHKLRGDGEVIVSRTHMEKLLDGYYTARPKERSRPNFDHL